MTVDALTRRARERRDQTTAFLTELIRRPSLSGHEDEAMAFLEDAFTAAGCIVERMPLPEQLPLDPEYNSIVSDISYAGRYNLRVVPQRGHTRTEAPRIILNAHVDVVPPSPGMEHAWEPTVDRATVYGRGACDDKGSIAALYLLAQLIERDSARVELHLVAEEENGGNGSLAVARERPTADACVVMEPTGLRVCPEVRGAVWFSAEFRGRAGHSGQPGASRSALLDAVAAISELQAYHQQLTKLPRESSLFDRFTNPAPLTIGRLEAGTWPATAPDRALLQGVLGFLPQHDRNEVCSEIIAIITGCGDETLPARVRFPYRHNGSVLAADHRLTQILSQTAREAAGAAAGSDSPDRPNDATTPPPGTIEGLPASCDAWYYSEFCDIPTVVFGPGELAHAHAADEQIDVREIEAAAVALAQLATAWSK